MYVNIRRLLTNCAGAEAGPLDTYTPRAPDPSTRRSRRSSSLVYVEADPSAGKQDMHDAHHRTSSRRRRRLDPDHQVEVIEDAAPVDDYDMYDANGMRIRVREI